MKKNEANLPEELQAIFQETSKVQSQDITKILHSAVTKLGKAKKSLQEAKTARMNLHNVWQKYLAASVDKWKEFCTDFEKKDTDMAQQVLQAAEAVKTAQESLDASRIQAKNSAVEDNENKDEQMTLEISDEEATDTLDQKGQVLKEGMQGMLATLDTLKAKADSLLVENATKRQRVQPPDAGGGDGQQRSVHFGAPGQ